MHPLELQNKPPTRPTDMTDATVGRLREPRIDEVTLALTRAEPVLEIATYMFAFLVAYELLPSSGEKHPRGFL